MITLGSLMLVLSVQYLVNNMMLLSAALWATRDIEGACCLYYVTQCSTLHDVACLQRCGRPGRLRRSRTIRS